MQPLTTSHKIYHRKRWWFLSEFESWCVLWVLITYGSSMHHFYSIVQLTLTTFFLNYACWFCSKLMLVNAS
jgi:hypothetical protein